MKSKVNLNKKLVSYIVFGLFIAASGTYLITGDKKTQNDKNIAQATSYNEQNSAQQQSYKAAESKTTTPQPSSQEMLYFLIEEEKLAHDVYTKLYEKYGANVFGNILQSESTHQDKVLSLITTRGLEDPRIDEIGKFKNPELQSLYDQLIKQGIQNATEAYKVGVAIEEKDIADISAYLAYATDQDVIDTLESLRKGSENHLRAFNKQL